MVNERERKREDREYERKRVQHPEEAAEVIYILLELLETLVEVC